MQKKLAMYGKARVGNAVVTLAKNVGIDIGLFDDADSAFDWNSFSAVIPSPGVPPTNRAYARGNMISELDFAHRYLPPGFKIIAVTGTDGKSTTAWMVYKILLQEFGENKVFLSGNFEIPFSETVAEIRSRGLKRGFIVLEVSSFMANLIGSRSDLLEKLPTGERDGSLLVDYTIFTNLETDHIDWHGSLSGYFTAKMKLVSHTKSRVIAHESLKRRMVELGMEFPQITRWYGQDTGLRDRTDGAEIVISWRRKYRLSETPLRGLHNANNLLAATLVGNELRICSKRTRTYLPSISHLPHRLELVTQKNWIQYIDDSKSTSAQSLKVALESFKNQSVVLIAGGSDKGDSFDGLASQIKLVCRAVICIGATRESFVRLAESVGIPAERADSMQEAVQKANAYARAGDTVLLSPGCASFGLFKNYLDRAQQFISAVQKIPIFETHE